VDQSVARKAQQEPEGEMEETQTAAAAEALAYRSRSQPTMIRKYPPHASLRRFAIEKLNQQIHAMARGFSANC